MKKLADLALWVLIIGGLVTGYAAVSGKNLIHVLSPDHSFTRITDGLIGIAALLVLGGRLKR